MFFFYAEFLQQWPKEPGQSIIGVVKDFNWVVNQSKVFAYLLTLDITIIY